MDLHAILCYVKKPSLTPHTHTHTHTHTHICVYIYIQVFQVTVPDLLTNHHQTFFFVQNCPLKCIFAYRNGFTFCLIPFGLTFEFSTVSTAVIILGCSTQFMARASQFNQVNVKNRVHTLCIQ